MDDPRQPNKPLALLADLVPREILNQARELARQIEREDYVKDYIARRGLMVAGGGTVFGLCCFLLILLLPAYIFPGLAQLAPWLKMLLLMGGLLMWFCAMLAFMYCLLSHLQQAALAQRAQRMKGAARK